MSTANITVAYVNQPKPGKKKGTIKTDDGQFYGVWPDLLSQFSPGKTYAIEYDEQNWQGRAFKSVKKILNESKGPADSRGMEMFVTGLIGRCIQGTGNFPAAPELTEWIKTAKLSWERGMNGAQEPSLEIIKVSPPPDFDDDLPF